MDSNSTRIYAESAAKFGEVSFEGRSYALLDGATPTNRVFAGWFGDADEGEEYAAEYSAAAIGDDGEEYVVRWQFDDLIAEARIEDERGGGLSHQPGRA